MTLLSWAVSTDAAYDFTGVLDYCSIAGGLFGYRASSTAACARPGPLLVMEPGKRYRLTLRNGAAAGSEPTNLHTHGLHIPGDANTDNVRREVAVGGCLGYNYTIPADHRGGTFWYHAHRHGSISSQLGGGASGVIVVPDRADVSSTAMSATASANLLALLGGGKTLQFASVRQPNSATLSTLCNGAAACTFGVVSQEWTRVRVSVMDPTGSERTLSLSCVGGGTACCKARQLARDSMLLLSVPADEATSWTLSSVARVDLAVQCTAPGSLSWNGGVANLVITAAASAASTASPFGDNGAAWVPTRPTYMQGSATDVVPAALRHTVSITPTSITWDGTQLSYNPLVSSGALTFGVRHQLSIGAGHPFHLHLYPMQVVSGCGGGYTVGTWYDTIRPSVTPCIVQFNVVNLGGTAVMHCHIPVHEDAGAMSWLSVSGGLSSGEGVNPSTEATATCAAV